MQPFQDQQQLFNTKSTISRPTTAIQQQICLELHEKHKLHYNNGSQCTSTMGSLQIQFPHRRPSSWVVEILHKRIDYLEALDIDPDHKDETKRGWRQSKMMFEGEDRQALQTLNGQQYNYSRRSMHTIQSAKSHTNHCKRWRTLLAFQRWSYEWPLTATTRTNACTKHKNHNTIQQL